MIEELPISKWRGPFDTDVKARALDALESGSVLYFPQLPFLLLESEIEFLDAKVADGKSKNISLDHTSGKMQASSLTGERAARLAAMIERFGREVNDESSVWYWCARNKIPVFCPGLTDGSVGDMLYFHLWQRKGFVLDIAQDIRRLNDLAMKAKRSGMVILGGGEAVKVNSSEVREAYETWCRTEGETPVAAKTLTTQLMGKYGIGRHKGSKGTRFLTGMTMVGSATQDEPATQDTDRGGR